MIRLAEQNAAGRTSHGMGTWYDRDRAPSTRCSAASATGAKAYMIAVEPVATLTSALQLLNGPNSSHPTPATPTPHPTGTPLSLVVASAPGISGSSPSAYDRRAVVPT